MHVIAPFISCVVRTPLPGEQISEYDQAVSQGFPEIYVITHKGIVKHHKLRGTDRYVRVAVDAIPGVQLQEFAPSIDRFLPAGKIPYDMFQQIHEFFKKVMEVKKADLEAMIWVMYNADRGYFLHVPDQVISKASVKYDWNSVPAGSSIVVDVHSHNTMGRNHS